MHFFVVPNVFLLWAVNCAPRNPPKKRLYELSGIFCPSKNRPRGFFARPPQMAGVGENLPHLYLSLFFFVGRGAQKGRHPYIYIYRFTARFWFQSVISFCLFLLFLVFLFFVIFIFLSLTNNKNNKKKHKKEMTEWFGVVLPSLVCTDGIYVSALVAIDCTVVGHAL